MGSLRLPAPHVPLLSSTLLQADLAQFSVAIGLRVFTIMLSRLCMWKTMYIRSSYIYAA